MNADMVRKIAIWEEYAPKQEHVDELRELLDLLARFLLGSNFLRDHGAAIAERTKLCDAAIKAVSS